MNNETKWMELALNLAREAAAEDEVPIGAVIVKNDQLLASTNNRVERDQDPTAHAEILAIRQAAAALGDKRLLECDLYVTLEPCTMCAGAIAMSRLRRVVFAAADPKGGAVVSGAKFFDLPTCHHRPQVTHHTAHETESGLMLKDFFKAKR